MLHLILFTVKIFGLHLLCLKKVIQFLLELVVVILTIVTLLSIFTVFYLEYIEHIPRVVYRKH